jgi:hypothetical protein
VFLKAAQLVADLHQRASFDNAALLRELINVPVAQIAQQVIAGDHLLR